MSQYFRKLLHVPFCTFYSKPSYSGSLCLLLSYVWYLYLFGSILLGACAPWYSGEADLPFQSHLECSSSQNPGLHPFYPIGQCFQPLHLTQDPWARHLSQSKSLWIILFPSVGPAANLPGPLSTFSLSLDIGAFGFNLLFRKPKDQNLLSTPTKIFIHFPHIW